MLKIIPISKDPPLPSYNMAPKPKEAISTALQQEAFASFNMGENWAVLYY